MYALLKEPADPTYKISKYDLELKMTALKN